MFLEPNVFWAVKNVDVLIRSVASLAIAGPCLDMYFQPNLFVTYRGPSLKFGTLSFIPISAQ